jgi:hypothetical protein
MLIIGGAWVYLDVGSAILHRFVHGLNILHVGEPVQLLFAKWKQFYKLCHDKPANKQIHSQIMFLELCHTLHYALYILYVMQKCYIYDISIVNNYLSIFNFFNMLRRY